jgi:hypothetical protein
MITRLLQSLAVLLREYRATRAARASVAAYERQRADDLEAGRVIARVGRFSRIPQRRLVAAFGRLLRREAAVRIDGAYLLSRHGWGEVCQPVSEYDLLVLRRLRDDPTYGPLMMGSPVYIAYLRTRGFLSPESWALTPAGLAACRGGRRCPRCGEKVKEDSFDVHVKLCLAEAGPKKGEE